MGTIAFFIGIHVQFPHYKDPPDACQPENHPVVLNHPAVTMDFLSKFAEALQKKISGAIIGFMWPKITYWLPRLLIIGFVASMVIPAPRFVTSMDDAEFLVWLLRLIWVLAFPAGFLAVLVLINLRKKRKK